MIKMQVEITSVRVYDGFDMDNRPEKRAECFVTQLSDDEPMQKCRGVVTLYGDAALKVHEGDTGTVKIMTSRKEFNRKDGSGTWTTNDVKMYSFEASTQ